MNLKHFFEDKNHRTELEQLEMESVSHCIDTFQTIKPQKEWVTAIDTGGHPYLINISKRENLPDVIRQELAINELLRSGPSRILTCSPIYLFALDRVEMNINTPGLNDPVYLHGELVGPYIQKNGKKTRRQKGQVKVRKFSSRSKSHKST